MGEFERRQDERDERRRADGVKARAVSFVSAHYAERALVPLCAIAAMHDELLHCSRDIYREFCCLTAEVQDLVLRYCGLDLRMEKVDGLFDRCVGRLDGVVRKSFPDDESPFCEGGKYLLYSLVRYGGDEVPIERIEYRPACMDGPLGKAASAGFDGTAPYGSRIADALSDAFGSRDPSRRPLAGLMDAYGLRAAHEIEACRFAAVAARCVAICGDGDSFVPSDSRCGSPEGYFAAAGCTMEDLFLLALFETYAHFIVADDSPGADPPAGKTGEPRPGRPGRRALACC